MAEIKLTKNELRNQQNRLMQLEKYLPTLQLKKAMLQAEVFEVRLEIQQLQEEFNQQYKKVSQDASLLSARSSVDPEEMVQVERVEKRYENIAGVEVPYFEGVVYVPLNYSLFDTPPWLDSMISELQATRSAEEKVHVSEEKKTALEKELREVSIRVNLFEKILIPRALRNIKKIKVFLGDQELAAVSQAKVAKRKIESHKSHDQRLQESSHAR